ncbi:MAG: hypothetical protein AAGC79_03230 [Pseudomonadota bacterium]
MAKDLRAYALIQDGDFGAIEASRLIARVNERFPDLGEMDVLLTAEEDWTNTAHSLAGQGKKWAWLAEEKTVIGVRQLFSVDEEAFVLHFTPFAYNWTRARGNALRLFEPDAALEAQRFHVAIAPMDPKPGNLAWSKAQATIIQVFAAAIADLANISAVYWQSSDGFQSPNQIQKAAEKAIRGETPIDHWVQFYPFTPDNPGLKSRKELMGMVSLGLNPFTGREVEVATSPMDLALAGDRCYGACWLALDSGKDIRDRDTMTDAENGDRLIIRDKPEGWLRRTDDLGAYVLIPPDSVIDPSTLALKPGEEVKPSKIGRLFGR